MQRQQADEERSEFWFEKKNSSCQYEKPGKFHYGIFAREAGFQRPLKKKLHYTALPRNVCPDVCVVCGEQASGYNYDVSYSNPLFHSGPNA